MRIKAKKPPIIRNELQTIARSFYLLFNRSKQVYAAKAAGFDPPDFFLQGFIEDRAYHTPVADLEDLRLRVKEAIVQVTAKWL